MGMPSRRFLLALMVFGFELAIANVSEADLALSTTDTVGNQSLEGNLATNFTLTSNSDYSVASGTALASETFTGLQGVLVGGFRYLDLSSPVTLGPGTYQLDAVGYSSSDLNGNSTLAGFSVSSNSFGGVLSVDGYAYNDSTALDPISNNTSSPAVFGAGNFSTSPLSVPEPPSIVLGSLGVLGVLMIRCLGSRRRRAPMRVARRLAGFIPARPI
jgi:hypothetical protein